MFLRASSLYRNTLTRSFFKKPSMLMAQKKNYLAVPQELTLGTLSELVKVPYFMVLQKYLEIEASAPYQTEQIISRETSEIMIKEYNFMPIYTEEEKTDPRPPVVTIMGHVDHGKTTLLDSLRNSSICASEFGGITQSIGAFSVKSSQGQITFIDTPGHLAFKDMRARGAEVTDIIVLVVCAVEGVQPQTLECIEHARASEVPIIVAFNKIDLPGADIPRVEGQLLKVGVELEKNGGDVLHVAISGKKRIGIDKLEEAILLQAELMELKENYDCMARGFVLESKIIQNKGNMCSVLVKRGTLRLNDHIFAGEAYGTVKRLLNEIGTDLKSIGPAQAAEVIGFDSLPHSGDRLLAVASHGKAVHLASRNKIKSDKLLAEKARSQEVKISIPKMSWAEKKKVRNMDTSALVERLRNELEMVESGEMDPEDARGIEQLHKRNSLPIEEQIANITSIFSTTDEEKNIKVILKAQNYGMLEAVQKSVEELAKIKKVKIYILKSNVGGITQEDIELSRIFNAPILCMNVKLTKNIMSDAMKANITLKSHKIIYHLLDDIQNMLKDVMETTTEIHNGKAVVKNIFDISKKKRKD